MTIAGELLTEVLRCETILKKINSEVPVFLNLTFEEVCYQAAEDKKVLVLAVIHSSAVRSMHHIARLLGGISASNEIYFWVADAESSSGKQVKKKFGEQSREAELFVLAPTTSTANPLLVGHFSGETLKGAHVETITEAVERASSALVSLKSQCSALENERVLKEKQDKEYKDTIKKDKRKRVARAREERMMEEPEDDFWEIKVKSADGTLHSRKFSKKGTYQEVYDRIGVAQEEDNFTLHRRGAGFIGDLCTYEEKLSGDETLLLIVRSESEAGGLLHSEISFFGNFQGREQDLAETLNDADYLGNEEEERIPEERETKKQRVLEQEDDTRRGQPSLTDEQVPSKGEGTVKEKKKRKRRKRNRQEVTEVSEKEKADGEKDGN